jgi:hypothetical protein
MQAFKSTGSLNVFLLILLLELQGMGLCPEAGARVNTVNGMLNSGELLLEVEHTANFTNCAGTSRIEESKELRAQRCHFPAKQSD